MSRVSNEQARDILREGQIEEFDLAADLLDSRAECERLRTKLAEAVEACKPWAHIAEMVPSHVADEHELSFGVWGQRYFRTIGDLRRAARVVDGVK